MNFKGKQWKQLQNFCLCCLTMVVLLEGILVARMLEVLLVEKFTLNYRIKVEHFRGWWNGHFYNLYQTEVFDGD